MLIGTYVLDTYILNMVSNIKWCSVVSDIAE